jgi:hypothetical protein
MTGSRPSNQALCDAFRKLLTEDFHVQELDRDVALAATKEWRRELWQSFNVIRRRMCPQAGQGERE